MEWIFDYAYLAILFPIIGLLINAILGKRLGEKGIGLVACLAAGAAFIVSFLTLLALLGIEASGEAHGARTVERVLYNWAIVGELRLPIALRLDPLAVTMMMVVSGVGSLIHIYAVGYMHGDPRFQRFFVYFNLFLASMLVLVMANNYLMMFVGWELVGLCSYLLIGFWFENIHNSIAGKKAFVVNRVGDFGFILGIFFIFVAFGTLEFTQLFEAIEHGHGIRLWGLVFTTKEVVTGITLLLFIGATGKSAQIPLFVWLPDAMAGPTPVSALIHAATMVTAGIYMITRSAPMYELATFSSDIVALVGALTALLAATIALAQFDIKRILAYSTISQLGFMVAAVGLGGYVAGMFHLVTHAFFKALLFLGSGSVIHGVEHGMHDDDPSPARNNQMNDEASTAGPDPHDPQDIRNMGGLSRRMKWTCATYTVGWLALAGVVPFSGFWSKDEILVDAWEHNVIIWALLTVAAFLTAFYMTRQMILVFGGDPRTPAATRAQESGNLMVVPLVILAILSLLGGVLNLPGVHSLANFIEHHAVDLNFGIAISSTAIALLGILMAWAVYSRGRMRVHTPDRLTGMPLNLFTHLNRGWYWDQFYNRFAVRPFYWLSDKLAVDVDWHFWHDFVHDKVLAEPFKTTAAFLANPIDLGIVDGFANSLAKLIQGSSGELGKVQTGYVRNYALSILLGVVTIVAWFVLR
jgi:NADH-quinone oxidoreductase subunit L